MMKLELPDNNASVLFHMGNALQSIARDIDTSLPVNGYKMTHTEKVGDVSHTVVTKPLVKLSDDEISESIDKMINAVAADCEVPVNRLTGVSVTDTIEPVYYDPINDTIDADGLPWDQRIHSRGKTRLDDNTWRMARKPKDKTDEEWAEYVEGVKTELRALMAISVATGAELDVLANIPVATAEQRAELKLAPPVVDDGISIEDITQAEINAGNLPPVVDAVVTPPVVDAVVTPPVVDHMATAPCGVTRAVKVLLDEHLERGLTSPPVVTPPVVNAVVTGPTTFPELMKFITVNNKKLTKESVDEALKAQGLASIALLAARTDLIPQVHAALVKLL